LFIKAIIITSEVNPELSSWHPTAGFVFKLDALYGLMMQQISQHIDIFISATTRQ